MIHAQKNVPTDFMWLKGQQATIGELRVGDINRLLCDETHVPNSRSHGPRIGALIDGVPVPGNAPAHESLQFGMTFHYRARRHACVESDDAGHSDHRVGPNADRKLGIGLRLYSVAPDFVALISFPQ